MAASGDVAQDVLDALTSGNPQEILDDLIAAPAVVANGVLNGAELDTSVFGIVEIPGILTDTTLLSERALDPSRWPFNSGSSLGGFSLRPRPKRRASTRRKTPAGQDV